MTPRRLLAHEDLMTTFRRVHFIGIGGVGMSGIAEVLHNLGYAVSGSDKANSPTAQRLAALGIVVHVGHEAAHVADADVVVTSSAIRQDNPELVAARASRIPVIPRAEMLGELMRFRRGVAIAGTHGKTTTTSLVASVLAEANYDPTFVIGGQLNAAGANARLGTGQYLVAEADESDGSFLLLSPVIAAVTNIDADHLENYGGDFAQVKKAFADFLHRLPFYGLAVLCVDDEEVAKLARDTTRRVMTYGISATDADVRATNVRQDGFQMLFDLQLPGRAQPLPVTLNLPGRHNVLNALAAVGVGLSLRIPIETMARAIAGFTGVHRRFESLGEWRGAAVIDDYAHHPTEVTATLEAARQSFPRGRVLAVFQPHLFSRTADQAEGFGNALMGADLAVVSDVYPSREQPIPGVTGELVVDAARRSGHRNVHYSPSWQDAPEILRENVREGDVIVTLGAGDVNRLGKQLVEDAQ
jgi:UDP-N-acetylmuramate--alanine ligase